MCALCTACVCKCVCALLVCLCPSGCDCAGDDDNGCPWDVEAKSLQATLPDLTEHPDIFIHLFFCSVSLESVWRLSSCHFNLQNDFWLSDCSVSSALLLYLCVWLWLIAACFLFFFSWHKCTCMAAPCYLDRRRQNACVTALNGSHRSHSEQNKHLALPRKHWWTSLRIPHSIFHNGGEVLMMSKRLWSATAIFVDVTRVLSPTSQKYDRVTRDW